MEGEAKSHVVKGKELSISILALNGDMIALNLSIVEGSTSTQVNA